ncbi:MAG TPA: M23 family metallopeptidase [Gammaproteobacteria bacterium]|nr:M23 family metallopeptidase [Gammaproteobacteria bacterium]
MLVLGLSAGLLTLGARWGSAYTLMQADAGIKDRQEFWRRQMGLQREKLAQLRQDTEANLNALALKLGEMQSHVTRLDALGERLTVMAKMKDGEFDFRSEPPVGGPVSAVQLSNTAQDIAHGIEKLWRELDDRTEQLTAMESLLMNRKLQDEIFPAGVPLMGGWMSSGFGPRTDPVSGRQEFHRGIDYAGEPGSSVIAMASGVVSWSGWRDEYGNVVEINHGNGYVTRYAHNKKNLVAVGDRVDKGQAIAIMGATGRTTGPHVHFEVLKDDVIVNPLKYIHTSGTADAEVVQDVPLPHSVN